MNYSIFLTDSAFEDLQSIYEYIAFSLSEKASAEKMYGHIVSEIESLAVMPERYPLYHDEPWYSKGVHALTVKKYVVFYNVDTSERKVTVLRILYGGRDLSAISD